MEMMKMKIRDLVFSEYNPRKISEFMFEKLKDSIKKFGYIEPVIVNKKNNKIVGGNQRVRALKEIYGEDYEIDVVVIDLDEKKEKALNIALNKIQGEWDDEKLRHILKELEGEELKLTGFSDTEIEILLKESESEIKELEILETKNKCPACGYEW